MKIGIIRERKYPPDTRVPLSPKQCKELVNDKGINILVEPSPDRCFSDQAYSDAGIPVTGDLSTCDILLGVKEPTLDSIIPEKSYFVFSHTIKAQPYNRALLKTFLTKKTRLIDYEVLTNSSGQRLIAFGHFAGLVGGHNALWTWRRRKQLSEIPRLHELESYDDMLPHYQKIEWTPVNIVLTGDGRVANGAATTLLNAGIRKVSPADFLNTNYAEPVFTQLGIKDYMRHKDQKAFELDTFFKNPDQFESTFAPYWKRAQVMINGIYWDPDSPAFFGLDDMVKSDFNIEVIADITCDIAPESSIPSTLKPSTILDPVYGFDPARNAIVDPYDESFIDVMAIDNLPNEIPRDASQSFGNQFITHILPELQKQSSEVLNRATIAENGKLGEHFSYLEDFVKG